MLRVVVLSAVLLPSLSACAVTDVKMADNKGQVGKCRAFGAGVIGTVVALGMTQYCVEELKKKGYHQVRNPEAEATAKNSAERQK
jgi:hypothetical protein